MERIAKHAKRILLIVITVTVMCACAMTVINIHIISAVSQYISTTPDTFTSDDIDAILVLGCFVQNDTPSDMLRDRLDCGIELYDLHIAPKLLVSGDHGHKDYDEVGVMKQYAIESGVTSEDIFMDHAGFSTYESMYRAKEIFGVDKMIIVTQEYHLYRSVYIARSLGIDAYGVPSDAHEYAKQFNREAREALARCKDFLCCIFKPEPTYLGDKIDIAGDGNVTNS